MLKDHSNELDYKSWRIDVISETMKPMKPGTITPITINTTAGHIVNWTIYKKLLWKKRAAERKKQNISRMPIKLELSRGSHMVYSLHQPNPKAREWNQNAPI